MKLAASNIGWAPEKLGRMLPELHDRGVQGLVIAPTMVWPEAPNVTAQQADELYQRVADADLKVVGMQSLTYGLDHAALSGDQAAKTRLTEHLKRQAELGGRLGVQSLIFGSPGLRRGVNRGEAVEVFAEVAQAAADNGTKLCIEPLSGYGNEFVTTTVEGVRLVQDVREASGSAQGFGLHLDGAAIAGQGKPNPHVDIMASQLLVGIESFDASAPELQPLSLHPEVPHEEMASALRTAQFAGYVSLEMREPTGAADPVAAYLHEVTVAHRLYV
ncbi:MAG TPA: TIM barrel protein [Candidatus Saccharimonadales bacterium]